METLAILLDNMLYGVEIINYEDFIALTIRFAFTLVVVTTIVRLIYYPISKRKDYLFTYILISTTVFLLCFLLENVKLELGFALGLFAIFGIIRYRTKQIPIKEMTYLFLVIGISVINALANDKISLLELAFTNIVIILITWGLEKLWLQNQATKNIIYEKIELIKPENMKELISDLKERTGLNINRVEVKKINFLKDTAKIRVYYIESKK